MTFALPDKEHLSGVHLQLQCHFPGHPTDRRNKEGYLACEILYLMCNPAHVHYTHT